MAKRMLLSCVALWVVLPVAWSAPSALADTIFESFEDGLGPWRPAADTRLAYVIHRSQQQAQEGVWSMRFTASGLADDGTLWMVREIQLPPGTWNVGLSYEVWAPSDGDVGLWIALGFIGDFEPMTEEDFTQSSAGENLGGIGTAGWSTRGMSRSFSPTVPTTIYVAFGYNIVFESVNTHFFDSVTVTGVPAQCGNGTCFGGEDGCNCPADCPTPPLTEVDCADGRDDDCDQAIDCFDPDCSADPVCDGIICDGDEVCDSEAGETLCVCPTDCGLVLQFAEFACHNGEDDDCDGVLDCDDPDCQATDPICQGGVCDQDGTCESGEDCGNCPTDCFSGGGAVCGNGMCEAGNGEDCLSCASDCNGKQSGNPSNRFCCGDGDGQNPVDCSDSRCTSGGFDCTDNPATPSCCGDGVCEGIEDDTNCAVDCAVGCSSPADCDDGVGCTDDDCVGGTCTFTPNDANCPDDGLFCNGTEFCEAVQDCSSSGDPCPSGTACNESTDTCDPQSCGGSGAPCSVNADCCSNKCKNGTCRGN